MEDQKQQIIERVKQANNILVTVSTNPSVDQLAACLGLTLMLNALGKHAAAVFSGEVPQAIEFLEPEKTIEKNTDSLRDFIIALDKSKADKLRYKVEDKVVKIFITPYKTSISEKDFEFSQGDFNVEVVLALGVHDQQDLDQAITAHGRILHDATVASVNTTAGTNLGTLNWVNDHASSLSEMVASLADSFDKKVLDNQVATALLTGIVAETDRFSNNRTSPDTMKVSAQLMAAGANQQLVATKLEEPPAPAPPESPVEPPHTPPPADDGPALEPLEPPKPHDGTLHIDHDHKTDDASQLPTQTSQPQPAEEPPAEAKEQPEKTSQKSAPEPTPPAEVERPQIHIDEHGGIAPINQSRQFLSGPDPTDVPNIAPANEDEEEKPSGASASSKLMFEPPELGGVLTANSRPETLEPTTDPLSKLPAPAPLLAHDMQPAATGAPTKPAEPPIATDTPLPPVAPSAGATMYDFKLPEPPAKSLPPLPLGGAPTATNPPTATPPTDDHHETLSELESHIHSDHDDTASDVDSARDAVVSAIDEAGQGPTPEPIAALNAQPLTGDLHPADTSAKPTKSKKADKPKKALAGNTPPAAKLAEPLKSEDITEPAPVAASPSDQPLDMPLPPASAASAPPPTDNADDASKPPPVPPPMLPLITPTGH